ncbi:peptidoglycan bridge formation glycyltransferase FemA/FemB family protein [bacterium]|nr:peptidoglycan bridge formation glycyltransferase FemA/FemB family protein [bacterium]
MKIVKLKKNRYQDYEHFLLEFDESLLYYSLKYKLYLECLLDATSNYLMVIDDSNKIQAILPLMEKKGKFGPVLNSLPYYGSYGGILSKSETARAFLLEYYQKLVSDYSASTYIANPMDLSLREMEYDILDTRIGQWTSLDFESNIETQILQCFSSSAKRNIRKAIKSKITVEVDNSAISFLYETHYSNMKLLGGKAKSQQSFECLEEFFEKGIDYKIYLARVDGKKVGALLLFYYNQTVEYFTPALVQEFRSLQALPLIIYQAMIDASKESFKWWNWGGTWLTQEGVYRFKKNFGAKDKEYSYFININNQEIYSSTKLELLAEYGDFYVLPFDQLKV